MASEMAEKFMNSLQTIEKENEVDALVELFSDEASLKRMTHKSYEGKGEAKQFWQEYLEPFDTISTEFFKVTEDDETVVLEWESKGKLANGHDIDYRGVSSFDTKGGKVVRFRTYYDSAAFLPEGAEQ